MSATRPKEVAHDETPSQVIDHPFTPRAQWWSLCKICKLAESAHRDTTTDKDAWKIGYYSDDVSEVLD